MSGSMSHRNDVLSWLRIYPSSIRTLVEDSTNAAAQFIPISVVNSDPHSTTTPTKLLEYLSRTAAGLSSTDQGDAETTRGVKRSIQMERRLPLKLALLRSSRASMRVQITTIWVEAKSVRVDRDRMNAEQK